MSNLLAEGEPDSHRLTQDERQRLLGQHSANVRAHIPEVVDDLPVLMDLRNEVADILRSTVTSKAIEGFEQDPEVSQWAHQGLRLHSSRNAGVCLFCDQQLPATRIDALESHFNAEYEQLVARVNEGRERLRGVLRRAEELRLPRPADVYEDLMGEYKNAKAALDLKWGRRCAYVRTLAQALDAKLAKPFRAVALEAELPKTRGRVVERLNGVIRKHNAACDQFGSRTAEARRRLAMGMVADCVDEYEKLARAEGEARKERDDCQERANGLRERVRRLESEIVAHRRPAEELNEDLRKYLGHAELCLEVMDTGYRLMRGATPAESLSDGERTALALLYFLKTLSWRRFSRSVGRNLRVSCGGNWRALSSTERGVCGFAVCAHPLARGCDRRSRT